jgi:opacity protein-like surface antigen
MKKPKTISAYVAAVCLCVGAMQQTLAQGYDTPLTIQGLNQTTTHSAASRGAGGITLAVKNDVSIMFTNPALLTSLEGIQFSIGALQQQRYTAQNQRYGGLQTHSAFGPLVEGTTGSLSDPDTLHGYPVTMLNQSDSVQRPFDGIGPSWANYKRERLPLQAFVAVPFALRGVRFVAGAGVVQYANLRRFYQNNNCFSPSVLSVLNGTISTTPLNTNPYMTQWYQYSQERDGSITGYGAALSAALMEKVSVGVSGMLLNGSSDDKEVQVGRGRMAFYNNSLRLDKQGMTNYTKTGTSDYSGAEFTLSGKYSGRRFTFGFSAKPPATITRKYTSQTLGDSVAAVSRLNHRVDSLHATWTESVSGEDKMALPWRGTVGISILVLDNLTVGLEYEMRPYASATYTSASGEESKPWLSASGWHVGAEYTASPWLTLRGGVHEEAEAYEPIANALRGEAVTYTVYALGFGLKFANLRFNVAYEYSDMKYVDTWSNAASINREFRQSVIADISYELPM